MKNSKSKNTEITQNKQSAWLQNYGGNQIQQNTLKKASIRISTIFQTNTVIKMDKTKIKNIMIPTVHWNTELKLKFNTEPIAIS